MRFRLLSLGSLSTRWVMQLSYYGGGRHGWGVQKHTAETISGYLNHACHQLALDCSAMQCAGRTDAGVHASGQIVHMDVATSVNHRMRIGAFHQYLPDNIRIHWLLPIESNFDARFRAISRSYRYWLWLDRVIPPWLHGWVAPYRWQDKLCSQLMAIASQHWLGKHDFSCFRAQGCQAKHPVRTIYEIQIQQYHASAICFDVRANGFLYHMVRNMVGSLVWIGQGKKGPDWAQELLQSGDRQQAGPMMPAHGLYLTKVTYPPAYCLPPTAVSAWP